MFENYVVIKPVIKKIITICSGKEVCPALDNVHKIIISNLQFVSHNSVRFILV